MSLDLSKNKAGLLSLIRFVFFFFGCKQHLNSILSNLSRLNENFMIMACSECKHRRLLGCQRFFSTNHLKIKQCMHLYNLSVYSCFCLKLLRDLTQLKCYQPSG